MLTVHGGQSLCCLLEWIDVHAAGAAKRAEGNAEHDTAQAKGWLEGVKDSVRGRV